MSERKEAHKYVEAVFIDPRHVGSSVRARVITSLWEEKTGGKRKAEVDAVVNLTDCHRAISWDFTLYGIDSPEDLVALKEHLDKIDAAIRVLQNFKRELRAGSKKAVAHIQAGS